MSILNDFSREELTTILNENPSLRGYTQGYLAEYSLKRQLEVVPGITSITKIRDHDSVKGDLLVIYKDTPITIEVKSVLSNTIKLRNDGGWEGKVQTKNTDNRVVTFPDGSRARTTLMLRNQFDILAISCYSATNDWTFYFMACSDLPRPETSTLTPLQNSYLVKNAFRFHPIYTPGVVVDPSLLIEQIHVSKTQV